MGIDAVALLRGRDLPLPSGLLVKTLDDGVLFFTHASFRSDPETLAVALRGKLGAALDAHVDPRGVFVLPDVAQPRSRSYEGVIDEIGEAGQWIPVVAAGHVPSSMANAAPGSFAAAMGEVMGALGGDMMAALQQAMASGDPAALQGLEAKLAEAFGGADKMEALGAKLQKAAEAESAGAADAVNARLAASFPIDAGAVDLDALKKHMESFQFDPAARAEIEALEKKFKGGG